MKKSSKLLVFAVLIAAMIIPEYISAQSWGGRRKAGLWDNWSINGHAGLTSFFGDVSIYDSEIVDKFNGSVDKFVGDEMFALFTGENSTDRAVQCAIEIQKRVMLEHTNDPVRIHIGIGINYGPAILGNMGAMNRMDYTALGATVNLGARLCGSAKAGQILVPKEIAEKLNIKVKMGEIFLMSFKGISQQLKITEVLSA